jgi:DNA polymerase
MLNQLAGQTDVVEAFRDGRDLYSEGASRFYRREITRADKNERHLGKVLELGCGYGMGAVKLRATCRAGALGGPPILLTEGEADAGIRTYRSAHPAVVAYWQTASRMIARLAGGPPLEWGPMLVKDGRIYLPNGAWLNYTTLEYDTEWQAWKIKSRQGWVKLYGGKLVENVVQALARVVLSQAMLRIEALGYKIATTTHDEVVIAVDGDEAPTAFERCKTEMERAPSWLPELPVKAEGGVSQRYDK